MQIYKKEHLGKLRVLHVQKVNLVMKTNIQIVILQIIAKHVLLDDMGMKMQCRTVNARVNVKKDFIAQAMY